MKLLVTGGAGFVGSSLALALKSGNSGWNVTAFDNLKRRGSELSLPRLAEGGIRFVHGDIRVPSDFEAAGPFDLILECSAEPSVLAGLDGSPAYVLDTNLGGTINCLEVARRNGAGFLFLSTSRIYPIGGLSQIPLREATTRFEIASGANGPGLSARGVAEDFPLDGARSLYGATKLCSEILIAEYVAAYDLRAVVNRCGVLAGPWQMGRVDQGIVMHWASSHLFGWPLEYIGYGGAGKQVRDILHIDDLADLVRLQIPRLAELKGRTYGVGGGRACSVSLVELTELCAEAAGRRVPVTGVPETRTADVPLYLTDTGRVNSEFGWSPRRTPAGIVTDSVAWLRTHQTELLEVFDPAGDRRRSSPPAV